MGSSLRGLVSTVNYTTHPPEVPRLFIELTLVHELWSDTPL